MASPSFISGGSHQDHRGTLHFFNHFHMDEIRRFYWVEHPDTQIVRAWQGHKREQKWFSVVDGAFKVVLVKPDNWDHPSADCEASEFILTKENPGVLHIPGGYANGIQALQPHSKLIIFSDLSVDDAADDNFRFDKNLWYNWDTV